MSIFNSHCLSPKWPESTLPQAPIPISFCGIFWIVEWSIFQLSWIVAFFTETISETISSLLFASFSFPSPVDIEVGKPWIWWYHLVQLSFKSFFEFKDPFFQAMFHFLNYSIFSDNIPWISRYFLVKISISSLDFTNCCDISSTCSTATVSLVLASSVFFSSINRH